jgi:type I restriction enzyme S subunit
LVGKTGIYRGERAAVFAGYLVRIIHGPDLDGEYLNYALNAPEFREYCLRVRTDGVSQSNINARKLAEYEVAWCPVAEQREIVRRVEALFRLADRVEQRVAAATARAGKLTQAILAKAFRGELVPTEAELARREGREYEPAAALLERVGGRVVQRPASPSKRRTKRRQSGTTENGR